MELANNSNICLALDVPQSVMDLSRFINIVVEETRDLVGAYKINPAFFARHGDTGRCMFNVIVYHAHMRDVPVIFDAKYGDVIHSNRMYAEYIWDELGVDAVTVNPYVGFDALTPFFDREGRTSFVLAATSNPDAAFLQESHGTAMTVVREAHMRNLEHPGQVGVVCGATREHILHEIQEHHAGLQVLVPGIGAQGGSVVSGDNIINVVGRRVMNHYDPESGEWLDNMVKEILELNAAV